ncbi:MAG: hypothetical protein ACJ76H_08445 [Bacteriovoracaceae bacterium]
MMNLLHKFLSKDLSDKRHIRKNFLHYFFNLPEHKWIEEDGVKKHFEDLFARVPSKLLESLMQKYPVVFIKSETMREHYAKPGVVFSNAVIVFPEFQKLLKTNKGSAVAWLAHELAFVIYELETEQVEPLMAEVEADKFVCDLGLTFELEELLLMLDETVEKRLRLTYLTINHFTGDN